MQTGLLFLLQGILLGGLISVPIGPVNVICLQKTLKLGRIQGFRATFGATLADSIYAMIAFLGLGTVIHLIEDFRTLFELTGGIVILVFGVVLFLKDSKRLYSKYSTRPNNNTNSILHSFMFAISNPLTVLFFLTYLSSISSDAMLQSKYQMIIFVGGVFIGSLTWFFSLSGLVDRFKKHVDLRRMHQINMICSGVLCITGVLLITKYLLN
ncbi:MAG: LysE family transporter [Bacteroidales bacterium]|nr:LysE family transporter [Bacteroidales bacterium]